MDATSHFMALFVGPGKEGAGVGGVWPSATGFDVATHSLQAKVYAGRSMVLGFALKALGWLETGPNSVPTEDGCRLATQELLLVLAMEIRTEGRQTTGRARNRKADQKHVE